MGLPNSPFTFSNQRKGLCIFSCALQDHPACFGGISPTWGGSPSFYLLHGIIEIYTARVYRISWHTDAVINMLDLLAISSSARLNKKFSPSKMRIAGSLRPGEGRKAHGSADAKLNR
jgi:hypothetical protein